MSQFQFETIIRIVKSGAPALANELCEALVGVIEENATLRRKVEELTPTTTETKKEEE